MPFSISSLFEIIKRFTFEIVEMERKIKQQQQQKKIRILCHVFYILIFWTRSNCGSDE